MVTTRANVESLKGVSHFDYLRFIWIGLNQKHFLFTIWIDFSFWLFLYYDEPKRKVCNYILTALVLAWHHYANSCLFLDVQDFSQHLNLDYSRTFKVNDELLEFVATRKKEKKNAGVKNLKYFKIPQSLFSLGICLWKLDKGKHSQRNKWIMIERYVMFQMKLMK